MASRQIEELIQSHESAVTAGLRYLSEAPGDVEIGGWTPRDTLCHMVVWHRATVEGMETVASGGEPYRTKDSTDEINARAVESMAAESTASLVEELRKLQTRLVTAVRQLSDPDATVMVRSDGAEASALLRLQMMTNHWNNHLAEFQARVSEGAS